MSKVQLKVVISEGMAVEEIREALDAYVLSRIADKMLDDGVAPMEVLNTFGIGLGDDDGVEGVDTGEEPSVENDTPVKTKPLIRGSGYLNNRTEVLKALEKLVNGIFSIVKIHALNGEVIARFTLSTSGLVTAKYADECVPMVGYTHTITSRSKFGIACARMDHITTINRG